MFQVVTMGGQNVKNVQTETLVNAGNGKEKDLETKNQ